MNTAICYPCGQARLCHTAPEYHDVVLSPVDLRRIAQAVEQLVSVGWLEKSRQKIDFRTGQCDVLILSRLHDSTKWGCSYTHLRSLLWRQVRSPTQVLDGSRSARIRGRQMTYTPVRVLVTGGAGFIGSAFVRRLLGDPAVARVVTLDRLSTGGDRRNLLGVLQDDRHRLVAGDICDMRLVGELLRAERIDTVVHLAAESHVDRSIADPLAFFDSNATGTLRLLQAVSGYWIDERDSPGRRAQQLDTAVRFHHVSTDEVYGSLDPGDAAFTEQSAYKPRSPYAASKAASDHLVRSWHHTYGLPVTISNSSNNYGPRQHHEKLIPTVIRCCLHNETIPLYGDGSNRRDWLYVDDHCAGIETVLSNGVVGATYNFGSGVEQANTVLVEAVCAEMDRLRPAQRPYASLVRFVEDRPGHDWRYAIDNSRVIEQLGWSAQTPLAQGLHDTCRWYLDHADRLS